MGTWGGSTSKLAELIFKPSSRYIFTTKQGEKILEKLSIEELRSTMESYGARNIGHLRNILTTAQMEALEIQLARRVLQEVSKPELREFQKALELRLETLQNQIQTLRSSNTELSAVSKASLSQKERLLVQEIARRDFQLKALVSPLSTELDLASRTSLSEANLLKKDVFKESTVANPFENLPAPSTNTALRGYGLKKIKDFWQSMNVCLRNQDPGSSRKEFWKYLKQSWAISAAENVGFYTLAKLIEASQEVDWDANEEQTALEKGAMVVQTGIKKIDPFELTTDLFTSLLGTTGAIPLLKIKSGLFWRYIRLTTYNLARTPIDMEVYQLIGDKLEPEIREILHMNPKEEGATPTRMTPSERLEFNLKWTLGSSWVSASLYHVIQGLLCLYPQSQKLQQTLSVIRWSASFGTSAVYFTLRNRSQQQASSDVLQPATPTAF